MLRFIRNIPMTILIAIWLFGALGYIIAPIILTVFFIIIVYFDYDDVHIWSKYGTLIAMTAVAWVPYVSYIVASNVG